MPNPSAAASSAGAPDLGIVDQRRGVAGRNRYAPTYMRTNRLFWFTVAAGLVLVLLAYAGFVAFMPDKTAGAWQIAAFLLSVLMLFACAVGLLGTLAYAVLKAWSERKVAE